jgi:hypothetical protein
MDHKHQLDYSTRKISSRLLLELKQALKSVDSYGSVEVFVQNGVVTQITVRNIKKTNGVNNNAK